MIVTFCRALARLRFQHRVTQLADGSLAYRLERAAGHVRVTAAEWEQTGRFFNESTARSLWAAKIATWLWLPGYVIYIGICDAVVPKGVARALPIYNTLFLGPLFATPFLIYLSHSYHVRRVCNAIDATFAERPLIPSPQSTPRRPPFWLDLLCLLFVVPHLIVSIIGEFYPEIFRNTPLTGSHIDWQAMFGFGLVVARLTWGMLSGHRAQASSRAALQ